MTSLANFRVNFQYNEITDDFEQVCCFFYAIMFVDEFPFLPWFFETFVFVILYSFLNRIAR